MMKFEPIFDFPTVLQCTYLYIHIDIYSKQWRKHYNQMSRGQTDDSKSTFTATESRFFGECLNVNFCFKKLE